MCVDVQFHPSIYYVCCASQINDRMTKLTCPGWKFPCLQGQLWRANVQYHPSIYYACCVVSFSLFRGLIPSRIPLYPQLIGVWMLLSSCPLIIKQTNGENVSVFRATCLCILAIIKVTGRVTLHRAPLSRRFCNAGSNYHCYDRYRLARLTHHF